MDNHFKRTVIVADGSFPVHPVPLSYLKNAERIICCDGSASTTVMAGFVPDAIVGDMDSIDPELASGFADRLYKNTEQETNDLTKAIEWCTARGYTDLVITGATGKREDHTVGNISLLSEYAEKTKVLMVTDTGYFLPLTATSVIQSFPGQQVSVFSPGCATEITSHGLRYKLDKTRLSNWWQATLNESLGDRFVLEFGNGRLIVFLKFKE